MTPNRLFPPHLRHAAWRQFEAHGYARPVTGVIYRGEPRPTCGMPLGGLGTGCLDLEPNGMLGYCTLFNHLINPRLLINLPFLGLSVDGQARVLVSDRLGKRDTPVMSVSPAAFPPIDYTPRYFDIGLEGVEIADSIDYWGHYPVVDMEFNTDLPVQAGLRAWSPFLPGDAAASMMPAAFFDFSLRNPGSQARAVTLAFSWPGLQAAAGEEAAGQVSRQGLEGELWGVHVSAGQPGTAFEMAYVLAAAAPGEGAAFRTGGPLNADGPAWAAVADRLPHASPGETGASLACSLTLAPGESRSLRLVFAWHAPHWDPSGAPSDPPSPRLFTHRYAAAYPDALSTARAAAAQADGLLRRVIAWQEQVYNDPAVPGWLADALINNLHLITETAVWGQAGEPLADWCRAEDGLFGLNECPRGCPQIECLPCSFYGNIPVVYFFPQAALSTLRGYKAYQLPNGRPPWVFGGVTASQPENRMPYDLAGPDAGYQAVLNGASYIIMAARYWQAAQDPDFLSEFWESLKRANDFSMSLRPAYGLSQVVAMPEPGTDEYALGDTEWFEAPEPGWKGYVAHAGGVRMAQLRIMENMAAAAGDRAYQEKCAAWFEAGARALEEHLWNGEYYLNFNEPETGLRSDLVFGYQLDGQWITAWHGLPGAFPRQRAVQALETIRRINCQISQSGAANYANPDGSPAAVGGYGTYSYFPPELFMLAMTYMYEGSPSFGMELLERCLANIVRWGYVWDAPNTVRGDKDTGERAFGADYYQNMMLWAVPAALHRQDLTGPQQEGGLVRRVIEASRGEVGLSGAHA